ncbi:hypothetical protein ACFWWM_30845 [Streptomyces sp. NPDC058682]|uniref:hypothetical protein n=1 Tax=unclassified Streptomyces TaxID=2593676 RepID=UPI00224EE7D5|nr:hypothetical protein [Streptomyces sp. NBC_01214]MCX4808680.1 hypothetical protein [Streptomyces sp. NBC_01214]
MPALRRPSRVTAIYLILATVLLAAGDFAVRQGPVAGLLPEATWGGWRSQEVLHWSAHIRVNVWAHAAEAEIHMGKAESITLMAYGEDAHGATSMDPTAFTLTPDGKLTGRELTFTG